MQFLLATCGAWHLRQTARAFQDRGALAGLWISDKNSTGITADKYRRCWPYHLAMKPFYQLAPQIWTERAIYANFPFWRSWLNCQKWPETKMSSMPLWDLPRNFLTAQTKPVH